MKSELVALLLCNSRLQFSLGFIVGKADLVEIVSIGCEGKRAPEPVEHRALWELSLESRI